MKKNLKKIKKVGMSLAIILMNSAVVLAAETTTSESMWSKFVDFMETWINRSGGIAFVMGLGMYGWNFYNDNPEGKSKAFKVVIGACIVVGGFKLGKDFLS